MCVCKREINTGREKNECLESSPDLQIIPQMPLKHYLPRDFRQLSGWYTINGSRGLYSVCCLQASYLNVNKKHCLLQTALLFSQAGLAHQAPHVCISCSFLLGAGLVHCILLVILFQRRHVTPSATNSHCNIIFIKRLPLSSLFSFASPLSSWKTATISCVHRYKLWR